MRGGVSPLPGAALPKTLPPASSGPARCWKAPPTAACSSAASPWCGTRAGPSCRQRRRASGGASKSSSPTARLRPESSGKGRRVPRGRSRERSSDTGGAGLRLTKMPPRRRPGPPFRCAVLRLEIRTLRSCVTPDRGGSGATQREGPLQGYVMGCHVLSCFPCRAVMRCGRSGHSAVGSAGVPGSFSGVFRLRVRGMAFLLSAPVSFPPPADGGTLIRA